MVRVYRVVKETGDRVVKETEERVVKETGDRVVKGTTGHAAAVKREAALEC